MPLRDHAGAAAAAPGDPEGRGLPVLAPAWLVATLSRANGFAMFLSMASLVAACIVLSASVILRYFLHAPTDWQDEVAVFLLVYATFGSSAWVQSRRGHVAIEAIAGYLPERVNLVRRWLCDLVSFLFCVFFTWKSWSLVQEAWVEGMTTSSTWAPPLWLPYGLMSAGMTLLCLQFVVQLLGAPPAGESRA
jgi:TRAP-type C4-dicarboxylate transport system permease small subunit